MYTKIFESVVLWSIDFFGARRSFMNLCSAVFLTNLSIDFLPDSLDVVLSSSKSAEHPIERNVGCPVVRIKHQVVDSVVHVPSAREDETPMSEPGANSRIQDHRHWNYGVAAEWERQETARVVHSRLDGVHAGAR